MHSAEVSWSACWWGPFGARVSHLSPAVVPRRGPSGYLHVLVVERTGERAACLHRVANAWGSLDLNPGDWLRSPGSSSIPCYPSALAGQGTTCRGLWL